MTWKITNAIRYQNITYVTEITVNGNHKSNSFNQFLINLHKNYFSETYNGIVSIVIS